MHLSVHLGPGEYATFHGIACQFVLVDSLQYVSNFTIHVNWRAKSKLDLLLQSILLTHGRYCWVPSISCGTLSLIYQITCWFYSKNLSRTSLPKWSVSCPKRNIYQLRHLLTSSGVQLTLNFGCFIVFRLLLGCFLFKCSGSSGKLWLSFSIWLSRLVVNW